MPSHVILVTGAGGNLGRAVASRLGAGGARLALMDRSADKLAEIRATLPEADILDLPGIDLTDPAAALSMVERVTSHFGRLDGLVNTVGGFRMGPVTGEIVPQWKAMMTANAEIALHLSAAVLPRMKAQGFGRIVHIAAQPGLKAGAKQAAYAASKAAVIRLTEAIAAEHRDDGITANCILPGTIDTPDNREAMPKADRSGWVSAEGIADLVAFLVSAEAAVVTGGAIPATGKG